MGENTAVSAPIPEAQYREIRKAKSHCLQAVQFEERFNLVLDNYNELECDLLRLAQNFLVRPHRPHADSMSERLLLDRRIVNLLSAGRLYLDHTDHGMSEIFGKESSERKAYNTERSRLYDLRFGYRFVEALRNHLQHHSLIVHVINYHAAAATKPFEEYTVIPQLDVDTLAENRDFKASVLAELKTFGKVIDLRGPIREYVASLGELHSFVRTQLATTIDTALTKYREAAESFSRSDDGRTVSFPTMQEVTDDGTQIIEKVGLPLHFTEHYGELAKQEIRAAKIPIAFASSGRLTPTQGSKPAQ